MQQERTTVPPTVFEEAPGSGGGGQRPNNHGSPPGNPTPVDEAAPVLGGVRRTRKCAGRVRPERRAEAHEIYNWLERDEAFARQFEEAKESATDVLEAECRRRATTGVSEPVFFRGEVVGYVQRYSDPCLLALLNAYRPERFKHRHARAAGEPGGPMPAIVHVSYNANMKPDDMK